MKRVIRIEARRDILRQIQYYLHEAAEGIAERFQESVTHSIRTLAQDPFIGSPRKPGNLAIPGLRTWPVRDFEDVRIYYIVAKNSVVVLRVLHGKRNLPAALQSGPS